MFKEIYSSDLDNMIPTNMLFRIFILRNLETNAEQCFHGHVRDHTNFYRFIQLPVNCVTEFPPYLKTVVTG